jgi:hypothetical protein
MRALLLVGMVFGAGCVRYVEIKDTRDAGREALLHFDRQIVLTGPFLAQSRRGKLTPVQREALRRMQSCVERFKRLRAQMVRLSARFDQLGGERDRITSEDPEWPEVKRLHAEYGRIKESANQALEELRQAAVTYLEATG